MSPTRSAAFFDLDKTIIAKSSTLAFSKPFFQGGLLSRRAVLRSAYANFMFALNGADHDKLEKMRAYLTQMVTGWDVDVVRQSVAETLHTIIDPLVYEEAVDLIEEHQAAGRDVVIVSASGSEVVEPIGEMLGVDHVIATTLLVEAGRYTGHVDFYAYGPNKAVAMEALAAERGYDLSESYAYSDSETDAPMLEAVGHPFAVNPDRALRRIAEDNGWPVLSFGRPVALRSRLSLDTKAGKAAAVAVIASAVGAITVALVSRRRHRLVA
ncbi:HAD-IB family hydrolase [Aeromicrobium sp. NPDC092404]|uniref:HAD family hydrolase n=1 Tax=Aeromicrobium sp. NPDC092404 TaxID=3154976 RepID=UPI003416B9B1